MTPPFSHRDAPGLVLASASETRAALLKAAGVIVIIQPAAVDESAIKSAFKAAGGSAGEAATALAELKADRVAAGCPDDTIVLGADQILTVDEDWFDKPADLDAARQQLERLSGREHQLHTAVVAFRGRARIWHHLDTTRLSMRPLSTSFLEAYLAAVGEEALQTVGGYHLERLGSQLFTRIDGDYHAILGLPLLPTLGFLRDQRVLLG